jgi:hypothetical protein
MGCSCRNLVALWVNLTLWSEVYLLKACEKGIVAGGLPLSVVHEMTYEFT